MLAGECVHTGCQYANLCMTLDQVNQTHRAEIAAFKSQKGDIMESRGYALWCKPGNHPFGDDDQKRKPITTTDDEGKEITFWICGEHRPEYMNPETKRKVSLKALMAQID